MPFIPTYISLNRSLDTLGGFTPVIDETGKITGYKTKIGGADSVFPFSEELIEQTVTKTVTYNNSNEQKVTFTFSNLKEVVGVKAFSGGKSGAYFYIVPSSTRPFAISGNTVTVWVVLYEGSASYGITAIGYAK